MFTLLLTIIRVLFIAIRIVVFEPNKCLLCVSQLNLFIAHRPRHDIKQMIDPTERDGLGVAFEKLLNISKSSTCNVLETAITCFFTDPDVPDIKLDKIRCILPTELSTRLLITVALRSYQDSSRKVYMLVNKHGADVNAIAYEPNPFGSNVLSMAIGSRRDDAAIALLDLGANANLPLGLRGQHPLIDISFKGSFDVLNFMWKHGADFNVTNGWGNTVLIAAITAGRVESVRFLLETVRLDPNVNGGTGLRVMQIEDTNVPLEHDVSWNIRRDLKWSPMHAAVNIKHPDGVEIVKLLLKAGATVHQRSELPKTTVDGVECLGYNALELLTIHALLPGERCDRHDADAMAECKQILEQAMNAIIAD